MTEQEFNPEEELTEETIQKVLNDGILDHEVEVAGIKDGELAYSLTGKGEAHAQEMLGGKDVAENTGLLFDILLKNKALGFEVPNTFQTFIIIATTLRIVKHCGAWNKLTEELKGVSHD